MFADYTKLVLLDYEKKRAGNALSSTLSLPTTAKLRDACLEVCPKRYKPRDVRVLSDVFGEADDQKMMLKQIENYDADKLKPLQNFINRKTKKPDTRVVELLAWLIDFEPRPFELGRHYALPETIVEESEKPEGINEEGENDVTPLDGAGTEEEQPQATNPEIVQTDPGAAEDPAGPTKPEPATPGAAEKNHEEEGTGTVPDEPDQTGAAPAGPGTTAEPADPVGVETAGTPEQAEPDKGSPMGAAIPEPEVRKPGSVLKRGLALLAVAFLALTALWVYHGGKKGPEPERIPMGQVLPAGNACMYWTGDHYEKISCGGTTGDTLVEPLDLKKMETFKKITRPDTITGQSKGSVWYVKINGGKDIEFYTSDGFHPIEQQRRLKPVTDYIIGKYIHPEP